MPIGLTLLLAASLGLNLAVAVAGALYVRKKGGWEFVKARLVARGLMKDAALDRLEGAYWLNKRELFELYAVVAGATMFVGDSLTDAAAWHELLNDPLALNRGISGDTTAGVLKRLDGVIAARPARIFLLVGINDVNTGVPTETILANYREILARLRAGTPDTRIVIQSLLPMDTLRWGIEPRDRILAVNRALPALADGEAVRFLDLYAHFAVDDRLDDACTHDGLHLNGEGYRRWRAALQPLL